MREQSFKNANNSRPNDIRGGETKVMKKLLSSLIVLALLLTMVTPAFASTQENLGQYESAVERLGALEILKGYTDGTFRPDNTITRAEFAAVAVRLLGLEVAAQASAGATQFKDQIDSWATGYVNVAAQQGIVKGYTDGTFRPKNPVTQAEALAMLIRVLGYEPAVSTTGWPSNYIVKAQQIGLSDGLTVAGNAPAARGFVAIAADQALLIPKLIQVGFGTQTKYVVSGSAEHGGTAETLLVDNLGATETTEVLTSIALNTDGQVSLTGTLVDTMDGFTVAGGTLASLFQHEVKVVKVNGKVLTITGAQPAAYTVTGKLGAAFTNTDTTVQVGTKVYDLVGGVYENNVAKTTFSYAKDQEVTLFLADETVTTNAGKDVRAVMVEKWTASDVVVTDLRAATTLSLARINSTLQVAKDAEITRNGEVATFADLAKKDVIRYKVDVTGKLVVVQATAVTTEGEVTAKEVVDGKYYVTAGSKLETSASVYNGVALEKSYTFKLNQDGKAVDAVEVAGETAKVKGIFVKKTDVNLLEDNVVVAKDKLEFVTSTGEKVVRYVKDGSFTASAGDYVEVTFDADGKVTNNATAVKLVNAAGVAATANLNSEIDVTAVNKNAEGNAISVALVTGATPLAVNVTGTDITVDVLAATTIQEVVDAINASPAASVLVEASVDATITDATVVVTPAAKTVLSGGVGFDVTAVSTTNKTVTVDNSGSKTYYVNADTVILDATNMKDIKVASFADLTKAQYVNYTVDAGYYTLIVITADGALDATSEYLGTVAGLYQSSRSIATTDGIEYFVTIKVDGVNTEYKVEKAAFDVVSLAAKNKLVTINDAVGIKGLYEAGTVVSAEATSLEVDVTNSLVEAKLVTDNTVIYIVDGTNVSFGVIEDVAEYVGALPNVNADIFVANSGVTLGGVAEVGVIVIEKK